MTTGQIIRFRRKQCKITLEQLGEAIGVSKQTVQRYESGVIANIPSDKIKLMAQALSTTPAALMGWEDDTTPAAANLRPLHRHAYPILGRIACGEPIMAVEEYEGYVSADQEEMADFCLIAQGDSMIGARIHDGDAVFIRRQETVDNGEIAAVIIDGEATLKRYYYYPREKKLVLFPENAKYEPFVYIGKELATVQVIGKAVAFQSRL